MNYSIKHIAALPGIFCLLISRLQAAPANDLFADRIIVSGTNAIVLGDNIDAGNEPGEDTGDGNIRWFYSVWYEWSAPTNGVLHLGLAGGFNSFIPAVKVYHGATVDNLFPAATLPDGSVPVTSGDVVEIQVSSIYYPVWSGGGGTGPFDLSLWLETPQPASTNDLFVDRIAISTNEYQFEGSLYDAGIEPGEPLISAVATQTVWFSFTSSDPGLLTVSAASPFFSPGVALFEGSSLGSLAPVSPLNGAPLAYDLAADTEYVLQVSSEWEPVGRFTLDTHFQKLANDSFTNSYQLVGTNISISGDNRTASLEPDEMLPLAGSAGRTLWYAWAAPVRARVFVSSGSCCMNRAIALYEGPDFDHLQRIVADQDGFYFMAEAGHVYYFQVDGANGKSGVFNLSIQAAAFQPATNDAFESAITLYSESAYGSAWINDATLQPGEPAHRNGAPCKSLWWNWQAPLNGTARVDHYGSFATNLTVAVYKGSTVDTLTLVAKGTNDSGPFFATGGTTYRIAVVADVPTLGDVLLRASVGGSFSGTTSVAVPGNLLLEPSFEGTGLEFAHWQLSTSSFGGGYVGERGGADGTTWPVLVGGVSIWQSFATIPGRNYEVKFAIRPDFGAASGKVRMWWDDRDVGVAQTTGGFWSWTNLTVSASNSVSVLKFEVVEGNIGLDGCSVVPVQAPPSIITQPSGLSTFEGASASFLVGVSGSVPLHYQWFSGAGSLTNGNSKVLSLDNVSLADAGSYYAIVTNAFGAVTSAPASLVIEAPTSPTIVLQPYGQRVPTGGYVALSVAAVGTPPLDFQWYKNDELVEGATNRQLIFPAFDSVDVGSYVVKVANGAQTVWSLPASLTLDADAVGGAALWFGNEIPDGGFTRKAPVFDTDGLTKLGGATFVAQLYAGPDLADIRPVGVPRVFREGYDAGLIDPVAVELPNVSPTNTAFVQVRVWQAGKGASYEEARALGSKFGKSEIFQIAPGIMPNPPPLWGLQSFSLQAGLPEFFAGRIDYVGPAPDGSPIWQLTGNAGYRYVIERSLNHSLWNPFLVLTNATGTIDFSDSNTNSGVSLYRARILD